MRLLEFQTGRNHIWTWSKSSEGAPTACRAFVQMSAVSLCLRSFRSAIAVDGRVSFALFPRVDKVRPLNGNVLDLNKVLNRALRPGEAGSDIDGVSSSLISPRADSYQLYRTRDFVHPYEFISFGSCAVILFCERRQELGLCLEVDLEQRQDRFDQSVKFLLLHIWVGPR